MRTMTRALVVMLLLLATPLLATDLVAYELGAPDVVWASWALDVGPPVVVNDDTATPTAFDGTLMVNVINLPADVRTDSRDASRNGRMEAPSLVVSLGDGDSGRKGVAALQRRGERQQV